MATPEARRIVMTRFGIDAPVALRIIREQTPVHPDHRLVAPGSLRSQALSLLYREVREGSLDEAEARSVLDGVTALRIRLLGDRVSRSVAWKLARQLDLDDTDRAEYLAVAQLQADALVTDDPQLAGWAAGIVELAPFERLATPPPG
jgi:predicted nucleic acid-binding protein